jgi:hypothetical protein
MRGQAPFSKLPDGNGAGPRAPRDLLSLLRPAGAFEYPQQLVDDPDLTLNEKRAILAAWAADARSADRAPAASRRAPGEPRPVGFDDVMDALRELNDEAAHGNARPHYRRVLGRRLRMTGRARFRG